MTESLQNPVTQLSGVGPQLAAKLARIHVHSLQDVLFHLPNRYQDRTKQSKLGTLVAGETAVIVGQVELAQVVKARRRSLVVRIADGTGNLTIRMFYFSRQQQQSFKQGLWVRCFGEVRRGQQGFEMIHPEYRLFPDRPLGGLEETLTPVYPTTDGVSQTAWRKITDQVLERSLPTVAELLEKNCLPQTMQESHTALSLVDALRFIHRPPPGTNLLLMEEADTPAHQRLIFEELLAHHFALRKSRQLRESDAAPVLESQGNLQQDFLDNLEFSLTVAQQRVSSEIAADLRRDVPMMRLVQGDVGSGKTVVAAMAMLQAVANRQQTVLMAPTELLAEQHYQTLLEWFVRLNIEVGWLSSKTPAKQKNSTLQRLASGELLVAVGTHALIQDAVQYKSLGLVVIDEQHRFGVGQRLALRNKMPDNIVPHQMLMTATPIPRTLAMSFYADLDVSSIDELPPGRIKVQTLVMPAETKRREIIARVAAACQQGRQAYWVCPLIEESEALSAEAATDTHKNLQSELQNLSIGLVHGRMKPKQKDEVMTAFRTAELDVLVATTVIEVGVDVPNASLMIIENAERMGLAQLHQLRGRVGRGHEQSYCILLYGEQLGQIARQRLKTLRETNDGFVIAEKDLQMRGAGELLGTRQTGSLSFKVADITRDQALLPQVEPAAQKLAALKPQNIDPLIERWVGSREEYANA